jgi:hypothetical protein
MSLPNPSLDTNVANNLINLSNLSLSNSNSNEDLNNQDMLSKLLIQQLLDGSKTGSTNNPIQIQNNQNGSSLWSYDNNNLQQQQQQRSNHDNRPFKH